jgi:hypothetical protein
MKKFFVVVSLSLVAMLLVAISPAQAANPTFYFEKVCDGSVSADSCVIQNAASPFGFLNGGTIKYFDHAYFQNPAGIIIESATILITASDGSQATGHIRWVNDRGYYTVVAGTGSLANIHMNGQVAALSWETMTFSVSGEYFFAP